MPSASASTSRSDPLLTAVLLIVVLAIAAAALVPLLRHNIGGSSSSATVHGSGVAASQARKLPAFDSVELGGSNVVTVHVGGSQSVIVHADTNLLRHITTDVRSGRLVVGDTPGSISPESALRVDVTVPSLHALDLSGSGTIVATGIKASALTATLDGSGVIRASGTAASLDVRLSGSGDVQLQQVAAVAVRATVEGSGRIVVKATKTLTASIPGSGAIIYEGHPRTVTTDVTGSGTVTHG